MPFALAAESDSSTNTGNDRYLIEPMAQWLAPISVPTAEVYFLSERAVASIAVKLTWTALMQRGL